MGLGEFLVNAIFPKRCFGCQRIGMYICHRCMADIKPIIRDICPYCLRGSFGGFTHPTCKKFYGIDGLKSLFYYSGVMQKVIKEIKYKLVREAISELFSSVHMYKSMFEYKKYFDNALFVPVPLHKNRFRKRGFNQSEIIAEQFGKLINMEVCSNVVFRKKDTPPQAFKKTREDRFTNMRGAFFIDRRNNDIYGKTLIVVDDIWTTGSTIKEIAKTIKKNTPTRVYALTLAR